MTIKEELKILEENKKKRYLFISPTIIQDCGPLVNNSETLELYINMDRNTENFAKFEIINLINSADQTGKETKNYYSFQLAFCGDYDDLPNDIGNLDEFIINNKERFIAIYKYEHSSMRLTVSSSDYVYLHLTKLLETFEMYNVKYEIDTACDEYVPSRFRNDRVTTFMISYCPENENKNENGHQLKKVKKEIKND